MNNLNELNELMDMLETSKIKKVEKWLPGSKELKIISKEMFNTPTADEKKVKTREISTQTEEELID
jgi:hypothetical protein